MTSLRGSQWKSTLLLAVATLMGLSFACEPDNKRKVPVAIGGASAAPTGSGGTSASTSSKATDSNGGATTSEEGGASSEGGASGAEGGSTSEGSSTPRGGSNGSSAPSSSAVGAGAAGGPTTLPDITCESDITCKPKGLLCDLGIKKCVQCREGKSDCDSGVACVNGMCGGALPTGCKKAADCADSADGKVCDVMRGKCVGCMATADCPTTTPSECVANQCVAIPVCETTANCEGSLVCNETASPARCVECVSDADCNAISKGNTCANNKCYTKCGDGASCSNGLKCNTSLNPNVCTECATNSDCSADKYCDKGACAADICKAGSEQACVGNGVAVCKADGDGFGAPTACKGEQVCSVGGGRAMCAEAVVEPVQEAVCDPAPGIATPCTLIPKYTGTQVVDAKGDDFCSVPAFELNFTNGIVTNLKSGYNATDFKQRAIAQVAWSEQGVHAFIKVLGEGKKVTNVNARSAEKPWDGDSIELMISSSNKLTGLTSADVDALHFILTYGIGVTVKSDGANGTHTAISDAAKFKGGKLANGEDYAVELMFPWPGTVPASGAEVRLDMAMNVDDGKDAQYPGREAQVTMIKADLAGQNTSCQGEPAPFCDDRLWCPTKME